MDSRAKVFPLRRKVARFIGNALERVHTSCNIITIIVYSAHANNT